MIRDLAGTKLWSFSLNTMVRVGKCDGYQDKGNPFGDEDEECPANPFSKESEITATSNPQNKNDNVKDATNPFEGNSDIMVDDNSNHFQYRSRATPPTIEVNGGTIAGNNSPSSNPFDSSMDAEDKYGNCYKEIDNPDEDTDEEDTQSLESCGEAESLEVENKDDKFGKDFTVTQMKKRRSTIRRIGSLRKTPSMKAFNCPKEFCGFFASSAHKLAIHVDRFHGAYHDLLTPDSPEMTQKFKKNSPIYGMKRLSDIMWGTMSTGNNIYGNFIKYVARAVGWLPHNANLIPAQTHSCIVHCAACTFETDF